MNDERTIDGYGGASMLIMAHRCSAMPHRTGVSHTPIMCGHCRAGDCIALIAGGADCDDHRWLSGRAERAWQAYAIRPYAAMVDGEPGRRSEHGGRMRYALTRR